MLTKLDNYILSLFTKFCHWFQRLTGKTNFWLAKFTVFLMFFRDGIYLYNYWFPVLKQKTSLFDAVFVGLIAPLWSMWALWNCDQGEANKYSETKTKSRLSLIYSQKFRKFYLVFNFFILLTEGISVFAKEGTLSFKLVYVILGNAVTAFIYLVVVDPLPPGKSKIQEWIEGFNAGFKKLVPISNK